MGFGREKKGFYRLPGLKPGARTRFIRHGPGRANRHHHVRCELRTEHGQIFPVDVESGDVSLIVLIASGDGGYLEQGFGHMRLLVLGLEVAYGDGKCAKLGGRVVKMLPVLI